jgi:hypothetical protein
MAAGRRSSARVRWLKRGTLLLAPLLSLLLLEAGFRYRAYRLNQDTLSAAFSVVDAEPSDGRVRFRDIIQPHPNPRIVYDLRPGLDVEYKGAPLRTNRFGFRGADCELAAAPGEITILGLGASDMFGHGVGNDDLCTLHLERLLAERHPERRWRVINTAVPSYNVVMEVETLKVKGLEFEPDFVLLQVASNHLDLPNYVRVYEDPLELDRSFLLGYLRELRSVRLETERRFGELAVVSKADLGWSRASDPSKIPERFRGLVGWEPCHAALDELAELGRRHGFEVLVFSHLDVGITKRLIRQASERGLHALTFIDDVVAHLDGRVPGEGFTKARFTGSDLVASASNSHPSPLLHEMLAGWILREMESRGIVERLLARER